MLEFTLKGKIRKVTMDDVEQLKNYIFVLNTMDEMRERESPEVAHIWDVVVVQVFRGTAGA